MILWIDGFDRHYEMENLCRIFFPYQKIDVRFAKPDGSEDGQAQAWIQAEETGEVVRFFAWARLDGEERSQRSECPETDFAGLVDFERRREYERSMGVLLFRILSELCGCEPKWGILTGIHPVKLLRQLTEQQGEEAAMDFFRRELLVSPEKTELARRTMAVQRPFLEQNRPESCSLYLSIPFCPTRCSYCSFVSQTVVRSARLFPE